MIALLLSPVAVCSIFVEIACFEDWWEVGEACHDF